MASRAIAPATPELRNSPGQAWLPSESVARKWRQFSETGTVIRTRAPAQPPVLRATPGEDGRHVELHWRVEPELDGGLRTVRIYRDGKVWKEIGTKPGAFLATGRDSPPGGLHAASVRDETVRPGSVHHYAISFFDGAGTESPLSPAVEVQLPASATVREIR